MKNGEMTAMPTQSNGGDIYGGLTKREMMAMNMMAANRNRGSNYNSWVDMATDAIEMTDALLAELEHTK